MAISSYNVILKQGNSKLVDIKSFPDLFGDPNTIEVTTLSDDMQKFIKGIKQMSTLTFTANYTKADYEKCAALEGSSNTYSLEFKGGEEGTFTIVGEMSVGISGAGVDEAIEMTLNIVATSVTMA